MQIISNIQKAVVALALIVLCTGCGKKPEDASKEKMHAILFGVMEYRGKNNEQFPHSLDDIKEYVGGDAKLKELLVNPLTGENPGYEYVKPDDAYEKKHLAPILYQLRGGKRDESLKVGHADGMVGIKGANPFKKT